MEKSFSASMLFLSHGRVCCDLIGLRAFSVLCFLWARSSPLLCDNVQLKLAIPLKLQTNFAGVVVSFDTISVVSGSSVVSGYVLGHVSLEVRT